MRRFSGVLVRADAQALPFRDSYFHSIVTSPPYFGLRNYSGAQKRIWGGLRDCDHDWLKLRKRAQTGGISPKQLTNRGVTGLGWVSTYALCSRCGAFYGGLGEEPTPEQHISNMVLVGRELWRVLRPDGVMWFNYGDTHQMNGNLVLMPHRIALALQSDGWTARNDLIWAKPNPMPDSVQGTRWERHRLKIQSASVDWREEARRTDRPLEGGAHVGGGNTGFKGHSATWEPCPGCERCERYGGYILRRGSFRHTRAHEYIFQFTKGMQYFCDQDAVMEGTDEGSRNPRSVIEVPTSGYSGKHFAVYPEALIAPLITASVPKHACPVCEDGWAPVRDEEKRVLGYRPTCEHYPDTPPDGLPFWTNGAIGNLDDMIPIPGIVFDPFGGSGTTGLVAKDLMRRFALIDIGHVYLDEQAKVRTGTGTPSNALDGLPLFSGGLE